MAAHVLYLHPFHHLLTLDWAYAATDRRDLRLDLLRGFAVVVMIVDHWGGPSWLYLMTGGNHFFVSGAEAFVFISGLVVGMVYGGIALKQGLRAAQTKALERALTLYKVTVVLTLLFVAVSVLCDFDWAQDLKMADPLSFALTIVTLHQTMYLTDIALLYTFLMIGAAGALWALNKGRTMWLLAGSFALWLAFQLFPQAIQMPWSIAGNTTFQLAAWQLLFVVAMALGYHRQAMERRLRNLPRRLYFIFALLLFVLLLQLYVTDGAILARWLPGLDTRVWMDELFRKGALAPGRLIASCVVFQFAYLATTLFWKPISSAFAWLLLPLGQNALYAYIMHVVLIALLYAVLPCLPFRLFEFGTLNTALQLMGILLIWFMIRREFLFRLVPR